MHHIPKKHANNNIEWMFRFVLQFASDVVLSFISVGLLTYTPLKLTLTIYICTRMRDDEKQGATYIRGGRALYL
jgi:hypothetical protein